MASTRFMSMASTCSANSLPAKPMVAVISASVPARGPKPKMATNSMAHMSVGTPRAMTMMMRARGYRMNRAGDTFQAANQASGMTIRMPTSEPSTDMPMVSTMDRRILGWAT